MRGPCLVPSRAGPDPFAFSPVDTHHFRFPFDRPCRPPRGVRAAVPVCRAYARTAKWSTSPPRKTPVTTCASFFANAFRLAETKEALSTRR